METVLRITLIYLFILIAMRAMGKRSFGQLSPFNLVTLLLIPEVAQQAMMREDFSITNAFIGLSTLFGLVFLTSILSHRFKKAEVLVEGSPTLLVSRGRLLTENMNVVRITSDEIFNEMHKSGLSRLEQVQWAILEADGKVSVVPSEEHETAMRRKPNTQPVE